MTDTEDDAMYRKWRAQGAIKILRGRDSRAAWRLRAPGRSSHAWMIEARQCGYLGRNPYDYGPDAWRISIVLCAETRPTEVAHLVATSEGEALASVAWLAAAAAP